MDIVCSHDPDHSNQTGIGKVDEDYNHQIEIII